MSSAPLWNALVWAPTALVVALGMELWAALLHGAVWHRWLWAIHRSHHAARPKGARLETNDALSLLHVPPTIALIVGGCVAAPSIPRELAFGAGLGMSAFGLGYLVVHDGLCHGRLPVGFLLRLRVVRGVVRAHRVHHTGPLGGAPFAFFLGVRELRRRVRARGARALPTNERPAHPEAPAHRGARAEAPRDLPPHRGVARGGPAQKVHDPAR